MMAGFWKSDTFYLLLIAPVPEAELATLARHPPTCRVERLLDAPTASRFVIMVAFIFGRA
jgi:hypothetical protein